ncbi:hypothetical protein CL619_04385 [archaeon]|nr:hypothetical protein [archaeon]
MEFLEVFAKGGFDCVIGNPPYVFGGNYGIESTEKNYFKNKYESGIGKVNLFTLLMEKSLKVLSQNGLLSFIIPNTFLRVTSYKKVREYLLNNSSIKQVIDLGTGVFKGAITSSIVIVIKNIIDQTNRINISSGLNDSSFQIKQSIFNNFDKGFVFNTTISEFGLKLILKLDSNSVKLGNLCKELIFGVVITKNIGDVIAKNKKGPFNKNFLEGRNITRYKINFDSKYLKYEKKLLHRSRTKEIFEANEKLLIQRITGGNRPVKVAYDNEQFYNKESINNLIMNDDCDYSIKYILGLMNSKLISWFYKVQFTNESKLTVNLSKQYLSQIPISKIDYDNIEDKTSHDQMVAYVDTMLELNKKLPKVKMEHEKTVIQRQIDSTDRKIDKLVYELYDLTEEEIKIVEENGK